MRARVISPIFLALLVAVGILPAAAGERDQAEQSLRQTATTSLPDLSWAPKVTPTWQLAACKADGAACTADADCCSGACKPIAEGRACVSNK